MKLKTDFITNSSSASFVIGNAHVTPWQRELIRNHIEVHRTLRWGCMSEYECTYSDEYDAWDIFETEDYIKGYTSMDNFDMFEFLDKIGIDEKYIESWHS